MDVSRDYVPRFRIVRRSSEYSHFLVHDLGRPCMPIAEHQLNSIAWNKDVVDRAPVYCDICQSLDGVVSRELARSLSPDSDPYSSRAKFCNP